VEIIAFLRFKVVGHTILTARKAASVKSVKSANYVRFVKEALGRLQAPAVGRWQARDSEKHAFQAPAGACATERASDF